MLSFHRLCLYTCLLFLVSCQPETEEPLSANPKIAALKLPKGFKADHLYSPGMNDQGSWVSMTFDDKGRMIASDQHGSLYRLTIPAIGADSTEKVKVEKLQLYLPDDTTAFSRSIGYCHGLLYAFQSLYVVINDEGARTRSRRSGIYRLKDTNQDDQFDQITLLKQLEGEGEHGPHSLALAPDGKSIFMIAGNFTRIPDMNTYTSHPHWEVDNLLPLLLDPNGHDNSVANHGGWISQFDPEGKEFTLYSTGFRNPFDLAFNEYGDLFTFDSDMEWDFGTPWYRPIRISHVTSGSEFGWRPGTAKWAPSNVDNLPALVNIGQGSPTGVFSGQQAHFPEKYKRSIFAFDWSFGIIYAIQPERSGAHYKADVEEFISGSPLPLTDGTIGPDGALYFLTGGRRTESDLYRVYHKDHQKYAQPLQTPSLSPAQKLRRKLESFHSKPSAEALAITWPELNNKDRFIRFAARVALEQQPSASWLERFRHEKDPQTVTQASIALIRSGEKQHQELILQKLTAVPFKSLKEADKLDWLRAVELLLLRFGKPDQPQVNQLIATLDPHYPAVSNYVNRSLSKLLVYLDAPGAVEKTMMLLKQAKDDPNDQKSVTASEDLILRNPDYGLNIAKMLSNVPPQQQTFYATVLSQAKNGWTPALRDEYFRWFYKAFGFKGGYSFIGFIDQIRKKALSTVPADQFAHYNALSGDSIVNLARMGLTPNMKQPKGPGRNWEIDSALALVNDGLQNRDFENGKAMFAATLCSSCHGMRGEGGVSGPDLTQVGSRFSYKDMLTAIIDPNKTISDQFGSTVFFLKKGGSVMGKLISEDAEKYVIAQNPFAMHQTRDLAKSEVSRTRVSEISPMLPGLINRLNPEELKDLLAYLKAGGNPDHEFFAPKK